MTHLTQKTATSPIAMAPDARKTAALCHQSNPPAKKARYRTMNANQNTITRIVTAILDPKEVIFVLSSNDEPWNTKRILSFLGPCTVQREATNRQNDADNRAEYCSKKSLVREPIGNEKEQRCSEH